MAATRIIQVSFLELIARLYCVYGVLHRLVSLARDFHPFSVDDPLEQAPHSHPRILGQKFDLQPEPNREALDSYRPSFHGGKIAPGGGKGKTERLPLHVLNPDYMVVVGERQVVVNP